MLRPIAAFVLLSAVSFGGSINIIDIPGAIPAADFQNLIASQTYKDWGNEPVVAVNPLNPNQIVVSSFAFSNNGIGFSPAGQGQKASLWYSGDGGSTWNLQYPLSSPTGSNRLLLPDDQSFRYNSSGTLQGAVLVFNPSTNGDNIYLGSSTNAANDAAWSWRTGTVNAAVTLNEADQPWLSVSGNNVYVAYDQFTNTNVLEHVAESSDGGLTFIDRTVTNGLQYNSNTNPGLRIATDGHGGVYSLVGYSDGYQSTNVVDMEYLLNADPQGNGNWQYTGSSAPGGLVVDSGGSVQGYNKNDNATSFGTVNTLRGNTTAIAVDQSGQRVYAVYGKRDTTGTDRLYLAEFSPGAGGALVERPGPVAFSISGQEAALPSITVLDDGEIVIMYDTADANGYHVHLTTSSDFGQTFSDSGIYDFTSPSLAALGKSNGDRALGDYQTLTSVGDTIYGTFPGRGLTNSGGVNTTNLIDPFFFSESLAPTPEPGTVALLTFALIGIAVSRRRDFSDR